MKQEQCWFLIFRKSPLKLITWPACLFYKGIFIIKWDFWWVYGLSHEVAMKQIGSFLGEIGIEKRKIETFDFSRGLFSSSWRWWVMFTILFLSTLEKYFANEITREHHFLVGPNNSQQALWLTLFQYFFQIVEVLLRGVL